MNKQQRQIGTIGNEPIYLQELNEDDIMLSFVTIGNSEKQITLYSATKFMPYEELKLNDII